MTTQTAIGLGIDAGGSRSRWALADASGTVTASGEVAGFTALQVHTEKGSGHIQATLAALATALPTPVTAVHAGITGYDGHASPMTDWCARTFHVAAGRVSLSTDVELIARDCFAPGAGYVVYAGTGSIAAYLDGDGVLHRAGGYGGILDDGGSGYWIAREALRHIWRAEDETPGAWRTSPMARALFDRLGGSDWNLTRAAVYTGPRGQLGQLALAVAETADADPVARTILSEAGHELARLANAMTTRFGPRPIALAGRVSQLHPVIASAMRSRVPRTQTIAVRSGDPHFAAARLALQALSATKGL
jgi:glucosamine kinase